MKYVCKEIYSEYNNSWFDSVVDDITCNFNNDIFLLENRDNGGINDDLIKVLINDLYEYSDYTVEYTYKNHYASYILDILKPYKKLSLKQALEIVVLLKNNNIDKNEFIVKALSIIFNSDFTVTILRGYSQSDWIYCFYNKDVVSYNFIQYIEACIFNTGIELFIVDARLDNVDGLDVNELENIYDGYYDYMVNYFLLDDKKKYVASVIGCDVNELVYYEIKNISTKTVITYDVDYKEGR